MTNTNNANDKYEKDPPRKEVYVLYPVGGAAGARKWLSDFKKKKKEGLPKDD